MSREPRVDDLRLPRRHFLAGVAAASALSGTGASAHEVRDESDRIVLRNSQATMVLAKEAAGAVVSLVDNLTGREFVARDPASPLFRLGCSQSDDASGDIEWLTSRDAETVVYALERSGSRQTARLTFRKLGGRRLDAECTVSVDSQEEKIFWQFALTASEPLILEQLHYPIVILRTAAREENGAEDAFVAGHRDGGIYPRPSRWAVGTRLDSLNQPGPLAAQFGCYYDARGGFYSATHDSKGYPKKLDVQRTDAGLQWAWHRYSHHDTASRFALDYDVVWAIVRSPAPDQPIDWRDAAEVYKAWALKQSWCARTLAQRDDLPSWLKQGPAMVRFRRRHTYYQPNVRLEYHHDWYSHLEHIQGWLQGYWQEHFAGVPLIVTFWGWEHLASWVSPKYFPPHPSEEGLRQRVQAVRDVGGHPFFWPSGYHWAVTFGQRNDGTFAWDDRERFETEGRPHAVVTRGGSPFQRTDVWLDGGTNSVLCRGTPWTRRWLDDIALELTRRGADLIQIDQVVYGCGPRDRGCCFSRRHGHPPGPGPWFAAAFGEQLRTMLETTRRNNPEMVLGFEGAQEFHLQQIGIQDYRDFEVFWRSHGPECTPEPVFAYLYHEFVPFFQSNPEGFRGKPPGGNMLQMAYSLVNGQMPHLVPHWPLQGSPALRNGDFEKWVGDEPDGWSRGLGTEHDKSAGLVCRDESVRHRGRCSIRLQNPTDSEALLLAQSIGIGEHEREVGGHGPEAGKTYRLSLWCTGAERSDVGRIGIETIDAADNTTGRWQIPLALHGEWRQAETAFTIPHRSVRLVVTCHLAAGRQAWLDDVRLEEPDGEGTYRIVMNKPLLPAEHELAIQWVRLFHGEGRPYLLFGRMLRPPRLIANKTKHTTFRPIQARVPLHIQGSGGTILQTAAIDISGNTDWVQREVVFTIPDSAERCTLHLFLRTQGKFWFDDIRLTELASGREILQNGDFEQWSDPGGEPVGWTAARRWHDVPCTGEVHRDRDQRQRGSFALRLVNGPEDIVHVFQSLPVDGTALARGLAYRLSLWMKVEDAGRLDRELPAILHNAYRAPDGSEAVVVANITDSPQAGTLEWHGQTIDRKSVG